MKTRLQTGAFLFLIALAAQAQESSDATLDTIDLGPRSDAPPVTPEEDPATLTTIVVTGEKLARTLTETSSSVAVASREDLDASTAASMKDVAASFANVLSASGDREIAIRGVPQTGIGGEGETISVYLDGVALPTQAARFAGPLSAWDLQQVEVLRGAQSTNQGRNSLAGSVVLRSREPTYDWDARLRTGVLSHDGHDYAFAGGGPLTERLRFRISAQDRYDRGDIFNVTRNEDDAGRERTRNARGRLSWTPAWLPGYEARYAYTQSDNEFGDPLHDASNGERTETSDVRGNEDDRTRVHGLEQSIDVGDHWQIESITGYAQIDNLYTIDYDRSAAQGGYSDNTLDDALISQELRAVYERGTLSGVIGYYYAESDKITRTQGYDIAAAGGAVLLNGFISSDSRVRTHALFAEADWDFTQSLRLTLGLRLNQERSQRSDESDLSLTLVAAVPGLPADLPIGVPLPDALGDALSEAFPDFVPPDYAVADREKFRDVLPKIALTWFSERDTSLSLSYQEGYRSGGTSVSFFGGSVSNFGPETTRTIEFAVRHVGFDQQLQINANTFYTRWRDQQVTIGEASGFETTTENAGRSHYFGMEMEAAWRFASAPLEIFAGLGLLQSRFDEFVNNGDDYKGNEFPYAPRHTSRLGMRLLEWKRLSGDIVAQHIASTFSDPDNDPLSRADARTLLHAKLSVRLPAGFSIAIFGRNLTDDPNEQGALVSGSRIASRYGESRTLGALLEWQL